MTERVRVNIRPQPQDYDVIIEAGALDRLADRLSERTQANTCIIISDSTVARLHGQRIEQMLVAAGLHCRLIEFAAGEANKSVEQWRRLSELLLQGGAERDACIIALGGGVTGDLAGFVAATYMRGITVVQVPTTLLAMIDASIGGKAGVDTTAGKNLIGAFHQPAFVLIDPLVLKTLPHEELRCGMAEAIKHGAIADADYMRWIAASAESVFEHDTNALKALIKRSVEIKARFVSDDVREAGARAALNFGHTIAHALEHVSSYQLAHGHAVALGMLVESVAAERAGVTEQGSADQLSTVLSAVGLPTTISNGMNLESLMAATRTDKKARSGAARYTLIARVGEVARQPDGQWTWPLPDDVVREALKAV